MPHVYNSSAMKCVTLMMIMITVPSIPKLTPMLVYFFMLSWASTFEPGSLALCSHSPTLAQDQRAIMWQMNETNLASIPAPAIMQATELPSSSWIPTSSPMTLT